MGRKLEHEVKHPCRSFKVKHLYSVFLLHDGMLSLSSPVLAKQKESHTPHCATAVFSPPTPSRSRLIPPHVIAVEHVS